jgi:PAS domain S-box-containing protein
MSLDTYFREFVHPEDFGLVVAELERSSSCPERDYTCKIEHRIIRRDGEVRTIAVLFRRTKDADGKVISVYGANQDITGQKQAEEALHAGREILSAAVELARLAPWKFNFTKNMLEFGEEFYAIYGTDVAREGTHMSIDQYVRKFVHPDDAWMLDVACNEAPASPERVYSGRLEHRIIRRDGVVRTIAVLFRRTKDADGKVISVYGANQDITEQKEAEEQVSSYQQKLQALVRELSLTEERERRRLAVNLHDQVSQTLAFAKIKLKMLNKSAEDRGCSCTDENNEILVMLDEAIQKTRSLTFDLCSPVLYELGFEASVQYLGERIQEQHGVHFIFKDDGSPKPLEEEMKIILFKAVRELLANIVKHAQSATVQVSIGTEGGNIKIEVVDDGKGFEISTVTKGFGLFNISERINHVGGYFHIDSKVGWGTRVILAGPLSRSGLGGA